MLPISLVVAIAENGVIGREGGLPWRLSSDLKRFKAVTMGKPMIMGRRTYDSIGRALPGRLSIVVTRDRAWRAEGVEVVGSTEDAVALANVRARCMTGAVEICIIGGGDIYAQAMPKADRLYVSHVDLDPAGDVRFPPIDPALWRVVAEPDVPRSERDQATYRVRIYERVHGAAH